MMNNTKSSPAKADVSAPQHTHLTNNKQHLTSTQIRLQSNNNNTNAMTVPTVATNEVFNRSTSSAPKISVSLFFEFISDIIFQFLSVYDCGQLALTCKTMHENSRRPAVFKREIILGRYTTNQDLLNFCTNQPHANNLNLSRCCFDVNDISPLSILINIQVLHIDGLGRMVDIYTLNSLIKLRTLHLTNFKFNKIQTFDKLVKLETLHLEGCDNLVDLYAIGKFVELISLDIWGCSDLVNISSIGNFVKLKNLQINYCNKIVDITPLCNLKNLEILNISRCKLDNINSLINLEYLHTVGLSWSSRLSNINSLNNLRSLVNLDLSWCINLTDISNLADLPNLRTVKIARCSKSLNTSGLSKKVLDFDFDFD